MKLITAIERPLFGLIERNKLTDLASYAPVALQQNISKKTDAAIQHIARQVADLAQEDTSKLTNALASFDRFTNLVDGALSHYYDASASFELRRAAGNNILSLAQSSKQLISDASTGASHAASEDLGQLSKDINKVLSLHFRPQEASSDTKLNVGISSEMQTSLTAGLLEIAKDDARFAKTFGDVFLKEGDVSGKAKLEAMRQSILSGDFSWLPEIKVTDNSLLRGASGAYDKGNDVIYLNQALPVSQNGKLVALGILMEEVGESIYAKINGQGKSQGDVGAQFSAHVMGIELSDSRLAALRHENDSGYLVTSDMEVIDVEFSFDFSWDSITNAAGDFFDAVDSGIGSMIGGVGDAFNTVSNGFVDGWDAVVGAGSNGWNTVSSWFSDEPAVPAFSPLANSSSLPLVNSSPLLYAPNQQGLVPEFLETANLNAGINPRPITQEILSTPAAPVPERISDTSADLTEVPAQDELSPMPTQGATTSDPYPDILIKKGDTLSELAVQHGITVSELLSVNPWIIDQDRIPAGQRLNLPLQQELSRMPTQGATTSDPYPDILINKGDTLSELAMQYGITVPELLSVNPWIIDQDRIPAGQRLNLPPSAFRGQVGNENINFQGGSRHPILANERSEVDKDQTRPPAYEMPVGDLTNEEAETLFRTGILPNGESILPVSEQGLIDIMAKAGFAGFVPTAAVLGGITEMGTGKNKFKVVVAVLPPFDKSADLAKQLMFGDVEGAEEAAWDAVAGTTFFIQLALPTGVRIITGKLGDTGTFEIGVPLHPAQPIGQYAGMDMRIFNNIRVGGEDMLSDPSLVHSVNGGGFAVLDLGPGDGPRSATGMTRKGLQNITSSTIEHVFKWMPSFFRIPTTAPQLATAGFLDLAQNEIVDRITENINPIVGLAGRVSEPFGTDLFPDADGDGELFTPLWFGETSQSDVRIPTSASD